MPTLGFYTPTIHINTWFLYSSDSNGVF
jgi:hypothetical protein